MIHKTEDEKKLKELTTLFLSLDENGQEKALNILRALTVVETDTFSQTLEKSEKQTI